MKAAPIGFPVLRRLNPANLVIANQTLYHFGSNTNASGLKFGLTILVLPNRFGFCLSQLLSPELLYTALTRQREQ